MMSKTAFQSVPNGRELSLSDFALFAQNWAMSTYLIVDSCTVAVYISFARSSLDRNSCDGRVPSGFS